MAPTFRHIRDINSRFVAGGVAAVGGGAVGDGDAGLGHFGEIILVILK